MVPAILIRSQASAEDASLSISGKAASPIDAIHVMLDVSDVSDVSIFTASPSMYTHNRYIE